MRYLSRADVEQVGLAGTEVLAIVEAAFRSKRAGAVEMPPKIGVHPREDAFIHAMPAYLADSDAVGLKCVAGYPTNKLAGVPYLHALFLLLDAGTGRPLAVMDATWITEARTAAASLVGIRALASEPVETLGIVGCGRQGTVHLELARQVLPGLRRAALYDPHSGRAETLAAQAEELEVEVTSAPEAVAAGAQVVISCAPIVRDPARPIRREHLEDSAVVCAIDFDATFSADIFEGAAAFAVDDAAQYEHYRGLGYFHGYPDPGAELGDLLDGPAPRGTGPSIYVPLGLALEDVAVAAELHRRATEAGIGHELPL
jgi:ornithine cyclodeaminase/alanine dehydrogenase-like protein (mu-crystallin family)